jgi:hypothetical protein
MSDHETPGFKVVDRRQAVSSDGGQEAESAPQGSTEETVNIGAEGDEDLSEASSSAVANDDDASEPTVDGDERGMPDPALLLSIAAMQLDVQMLARLLMPIFDGQAWRAMGFLVDPKTGETRKDLAGAQLAIDCVQFLLGKVEQSLSSDERREMQRRLNDLRMNYLSKMREGQI